MFFVLGSLFPSLFLVLCSLFFVDQVCSLFQVENLLFVLCFLFFVDQVLFFVLILGNDNEQRTMNNEQIKKIGFLYNLIL